MRLVAIYEREEALPMAHYQLTSKQYHILWNKNHAPVLTIKSGDTVTVDTEEVTNGFFNINSTAADIPNLDLDACYPLVGPIYVEGAEPGDTLAVDILDIAAKDWGFMFILPGLGLLSDTFTTPYFRTFDISNGNYINFRDDIKIPIEPFFGTIGVCPADADGQGVMQPGSFGGNMDCRYLKKGATLYLPVEVEGALFSCGDGHAAQGDGEVCVTALEAPLTGTFRFRLLKDRHIKAPQFETPALLNVASDPAGYYGTSGIGPDLMENSKKALLDMIDYVSERYNMSKEDAYLLCSLCADLKIAEIVDGGVFVVNAVLPLSVFQ